jgi:hypothetical protein
MKTNMHTMKQWLLAVITLFAVAALNFNAAAAKGPKSPPSPFAGEWCAPGWTMSISTDGRISGSVNLGDTDASLSGSISNEGYFQFQYSYTVHSGNCWFDCARINKKRQTVRYSGWAIIDDDGNLVGITDGENPAVIVWSPCP